MKKLELIAVMLLIILFASCHKKHTCTCTLTQSGTTKTMAVGEFNTSKSKARSECDKTKSALQAAYPTGIDCTLK